MKKLLTILLCMTLVLSFVACSSNDSTEDKVEVTEDKVEVVEEKVMTILEAINSVEGLRNTEHERTYVNIWHLANDDYANLEINTEDDVWNYDTCDKLNQLHSKLGFSGALLEKMKDTRSLDGTLTDENENYKVTWKLNDLKLLVIYEMK
ncbi:MAG: hypothetical protein IJB70_01000 [Clostridia bacterium]|nr:hypothetical protein [Clostridia bacterium]